MNPTASHDVTVNAASSPSSSDIIPDLLRRIRHVVGTAPSVALHEPDLGELERRYVADCVASGWVSSVGSYVNRFEQRVSEYTGVSHAVATVNGTAALHVSLLLAGVGKGDEVLCPALSFVATTNAVSYCGAVPHFVDVESQTLGLDAGKLADYLKDISILDSGVRINRLTKRRLSAIVPMHTLGHAVDLEGLNVVAEQFQLPIVEDAAEALGTFYDGRHTGSFGLVGALSFNGNKIITTGGGGAILTDDPQLAARAKHLTTTAKTPHRWRYFHDEIGFNYRMPNLNAALGCAQLERFEELRNRKRQLASRYRDAFTDCAYASFVDEVNRESSNCWLNAIRLKLNGAAGLRQADMRDKLLEATNDAGVMTRPLWELLCELPMYEACPQMDLSMSRQLVAETICVPSSASLGENKVIAIEREVLHLTSDDA